MTKKLFITGCDSNTQWMLKWFYENFKKHNPDAELLIWDFGMKNTPYPKITKKLETQEIGWFLKPRAMLEASKMADYTCWIDTDCDIIDNIEDIWEYCEPDKLAMVEDIPWSKRRGERWHNSGVVAFKGTPKILKDWVVKTIFTNEVGDQEVLHKLVREGLNRLKYITDLPREYNVLRLDFLDGTNAKNAKIHHWTGLKGKEEIKKLMRK